MQDLVALAEQFLVSVWGRGDLRFAESLCAENYTDFTCMGEEQDDFLQLQDSVQELRDAFPDLKVRVVDSFQDKDYVMSRTHKAQNSAICSIAFTVCWMWRAWCARHWSMTANILPR